MEQTSTVGNALCPAIQVIGSVTPVETRISRLGPFVTFLLAESHARTYPAEARRDSAPAELSSINQPLPLSALFEMMMIGTYSSCKDCGRSKSVGLVWFLSFFLNF